MGKSERRRWWPPFRRMLLAAASAALADPPRLEPRPGWWSGAALTPPIPAKRRLRDRLWRALAGETVVVPWYDGLQLELVLGNDLSRCLYVGGDFDPNEFAFLARALRPGMTALDIGANEGLYSLFARARVGEAGRVIGLEPSEREAAHADANLRLNGYADVEIVRVAAGDRDGMARLRLAVSAHAGHNSLATFAAPWVHEMGESEVPLVRLDTLVQQRRLHRVDLVKLDIEGAELAALRGAEQVLRRDKPLLLIEVMDESLREHGATAGDLLGFVRSLGYRVYEFSPHTGKPAPVDDRLPESVNVVAAAGPLP